MLDAYLAHDEVGGGVDGRVREEAREAGESKGNRGRRVGHGDERARAETNGVQWSWGMEWR